jgi:hypothetical protein
MYVTISSICWYHSFVNRRTLICCCRRFLPSFQCIVVSLFRKMMMTSKGGLCMEMNELDINIQSLVFIFTPFRSRLDSNSSLTSSNLYVWENLLFISESLLTLWLSWHQREKRAANWKWAFKHKLFTSQKWNLTFLDFPPFFWWWKLRFVQFWINVVLLDCCRYSSERKLIWNVFLGGNQS